MDNIYVLAKDGKPLMPCHSYRKVKHLLGDGKASVVRTRPFTIRLRYDLEDPVVNECLMGIDPGRTNIGVCVIDGEGRVLFASDVTTRNKTILRFLASRKAARQASRRGERKVRQRRAMASDKTGMARATEFWRMLPGCGKPIRCKVIRNQEAKFNHRMRPVGWLTPSARHLVLTHINVVRKVMGLLPVSGIMIEVNRFDFARMENPNIRNWEYQKGRLYGFKDKHEAVSYQQEGRCLLCGKGIEHYHHLVPKSQGGSDTIDNLAGLCIKCHDKVHKHVGAAKRLRTKKEGILKKYGALSVLNQAMPYILDELASRYYIGVTTGYDTKRIREHYGLQKDHYVDAWCIAMSSKLPVDDLLDEGPIGRPQFDGARFDIMQFRRHDRKRIKAQRERTYYLDGKAVCKNRRLRTGQATYPSLAEFRKEHPMLVSRLTVRKSKRSYNDMDRVMPGAEVTYKGKRYVLKGNHNDRYILLGMDGSGVPKKRCTVTRRNTGLVFI